MSLIVFSKESLSIFEKNFLSKLNDNPDFSNRRIVSSPRAIGDLVQDIASEQLSNCFPENVIKDFNSAFARRAMADVAFSDFDDDYFVVDIKTHNKSTDFNMPNLTSVERLARFYEDDKNFFVILLVEYRVVNDVAIFDSAKLIPIEHLNWNCLTIGALGWGQIQIANSNYVNINNKQTRKSWMLELCDILDVFYPKEIAKIENRMSRFQQVREFWENK